MQTVVQITTDAAMLTGEDIVENREVEVDSGIGVARSLSILDVSGKLASALEDRNPEVKIGLIGVGKQGQRHLRHLSEQEIQTVAVDAFMKPEVFDSYGDKKTVQLEKTDADRVINDPTINAVVIVTPGNTHFDVVKRALLAGKDVLVEKPFTPTTAEAEELVELATERHLILMVGHNRSYLPHLLRLKEIIKSGKLGKILSVEGNYLNPHQNYDKTHSALEGLGYHQFYMIDDLLGQDHPDEVLSGVVSDDWETVGVKVRYGNIPVTVKLSREYDGPKTRNIIVRGSDFTATFDYTHEAESTELSFEPTQKEIVKEQVTYDPEVLAELQKAVPLNEEEIRPSLHHQLKAFLEAIHTRTEPPSKGAAAISVVNTLEEIRHKLEANHFYIAQSFIPESDLVNLVKLVNQKVGNKGGIVTIEGSGGVGKSTFSQSFSDIYQLMFPSKQCVVIPYDEMTLPWKLRSVVKKRVLGEDLNVEELDILKAQGWENITSEEHVGWNNSAFEEHLKTLRSLFDNPTISGLTLVNPEAYVKTEKGREVGKTQRTVRSKDALVIVEGKYLAGNFRQYADYTVRLDAPADQIRLQFAQERANYLPGHEVEKLLRWYDSFTWPSWEAYKARVTVDKVINIKPILAAATSAAMLTEGEERPQTVPLKEFIRNIITRDDLFEKIDFVPTVSPHIHFKAPAYSQDDEKDLYTILAELIAYKFQPNMKGKIRIFVDNNKVYITKNCRIDWDEIKKKYDELLAENNLYVFHNEDGSIGELAHKIRVPEVLTSLGIFKPATQKEIDDLFASSKGRDTMFFNRRGISFPQDNSPEGLYMAQIASQKIGAELKVVDGGNESGEVTFEISFSHETPFTVIDQAMQTSTNVVNGSKVGIVAFFPNLANRGAFRSIDRMVFEKGSEGVRQLYSEGAESLGYLKDGRPDPTAIFNVNITKEGMDENSKFLQTLLIVHSLALNNYFLEQARKDNIPVQIQAYTAESFGVVTSAVASGALSLKDALKIIDDVLQGLIESKNDSLGEEHTRYV